MSPDTHFPPTEDDPMNTRDRLAQATEDDLRALLMEAEEERDRAREICEWAEEQLFELQSLEYEGSAHDFQSGPLTFLLNKLSTKIILGGG